MPMDKAGKYHLNPMDIRDEQKPEKPAVQEKKGEPVADEVHIHISKKPEGGYHSRMETGDELGPDESDHKSLAEAHAAAAEALEQKFGEKAVEEAEEEISPGIHKEVEKKLGGSGSSLLDGLKR